MAVKPILDNIKLAYNTTTGKLHFVQITPTGIVDLGEIAFG